MLGSLVYFFNLCNTERLKNCSEVLFVAGTTKVNFSHLKTYLRLDEYMQATHYTLLLLFTI